MIVPMKKVAVITQPKDAATILSRLRSLGVVHVEHKEPPKGTELDLIQEDLSLINQALEILSEPEFVKVAGEKTNITADDPKFIAKHVIDLHKRFDQLGEYSRGIKNTIAEWQAWGDFDPDDLARLREKGIFIRLYQIPAKEIKNLPAGVITKQLFSSAGLINCAVICRENIEIPFQEISLPKMGLTKMRNRLYEDSRLMEIIADDICKYVSYCSSLVKVKARLEKDLEFYQALKGMDGTGEIVYLSGYVPIEAVRLLKEAAKKDKFGLLVTDPSSQDQVPTLLRNPRWVALIRPVLRLLGILPGYQELDTSFLFLIFFSIFFGILIGDAGYGLVYLALTFLIQKKKGALVKNGAPSELKPKVTLGAESRPPTFEAGRRDKNVFSLAYLLSSCAIIWGVLSGTFFGQEWLTKSNIRPLIPQLNDPVQMQTFCFLLGAIHLTIAHSWRALVKFPNLAFLADLGWIAVLWVCFFLARTFILGQPFPEFGLFLAVCGIVLVLFFNQPRRSLAGRLGAGFISVTFGLSFMSAFTDVVSYVRLFAVGLAGLAIANTTNAMAGGLGTGLPAFAGGVLITVFGHALNIVLGPIAILVHGVRLNVLEFGLNHTNTTWSGVAYRPFAEEVS